jgi:predicted nucleotide-binding protein
MRLSCAVRERTINGLETHLNTGSSLQALLVAPWPDTARAKSDRLLATLAKMSAHPGAEIDLIPSEDSVLAFTVNRQEFDHYLNDLKERDFIRIVAQGLSYVKLKVTNLGYEHHEQILAAQLESAVHRNGGHEDQKGEPMPIQLEPKVDRRKVFLVHGRNKAAHDAMVALLKSLDLDPVDFDSAKRAMRKSPFSISDVLDYAFSNAWAVMVLITGDDVGRLRDCHWREKESNNEKDYQAQPRLNVVFEAGLAFARNPERTILVQIGDAKDFSDLAGQYIHHFQGTEENRNDLKLCLSNIGCAVRDSSLEWLRAGDFSAGLQPLQSAQEPLPHDAVAYQISEEEKELILASGKEGKFILMSVGNSLRNWVVAEHTNFVKDDDPAFTARYMEAFEGLQEKKLVTHQGGKLYLLTGKGFKTQTKLMEDRSNT